MSATKKQLLALAVLMHEHKPKLTEPPAFGPSPFEAWLQSVKDIDYCIVPVRYSNAFKEACQNGGFWNRDLEGKS